MGNFLWYSFDLLDGNCLPNGNLRPGDRGEDGGAPALDIGAGKLKGTARTRSFMRQQAGSHRAMARTGHLEPVCKAGRGHGVPAGFPTG